MPERVDLVDSAGVIQERAVLRCEADESGLYVPIIIAVVFNGLRQALVQQRAMPKKDNPGDYDHICGAIWSGETPKEAAWREADEETGVVPQNLQLVVHGVNVYRRYRYLYVGEADEEPCIKNPNEVMWTGYMDPDELHAKRSSGELTFVAGFFEDMALAREALHR